MITYPKVVVITGAAGFIGRYVARYFLDQEWVVVGIDNTPPDQISLQNLTAYHQINLPDDRLSDILLKASPQVFVHCAGQASVPISVKEPRKDFYGNTVLTFDILDTLRLCTPECRFILLSSAAIYGNPTSLPILENHEKKPISPYGFHKLQCEQICLEFNQLYQIPTASARIFSAYGDGLRRQVLWDICQKVIAHSSVSLQGTGQESRDFIHALDIAKAIFIIANTAPMQGEAYNLASGDSITISALSELVLKAFNRECRLTFDGHVPMGNPLNWEADISKLRNLGFTPSILLEEGVQSFVSWCLTEAASI